MTARRAFRALERRTRPGYTPSRGGRSTTRSAATASVATTGGCRGYATAVLVALGPRVFSNMRAHRVPHPSRDHRELDAGGPSQPLELRHGVARYPGGAMTAVHIVEPADPHGNRRPFSRLRSKHGPRSRSASAVTPELIFGWGCGIHSPRGFTARQRRPARGFTPSGLARF